MNNRKGKVMETIKTYIENVFSAFPKNERVTTLKRDMLLGMEEKYHALKNEGKSENEAVGSVIADFGNIDEIAAELGVQPNMVEAATDADEKDDSIPVSREDALAFLAQVKKSAFGIGIGVWVVLIGVAAMLLVGGFGVVGWRGPGFELSTFTNALASGNGAEVWMAVAILMLFIAIAAAVPFFIKHGWALNRYYEKYGTKSLFLDVSTRAEIESMREKFLSKFVTLIAVGTAVVLLAAGSFLLLASMARMEVVVATLTPAIGLSVLLFLIGGMEYVAYDFLLGRGEYENKKKLEKAERIIGTVASIFWPLMTAIYLLWSFIGNSWNISWIIWPVSGILFGAFAGGISTWNEGKKR